MYASELLSSLENICNEGIRKERRCSNRLLVNVCSEWFANSIRNAHKNYRVAGESLMVNGCCSTS